MGEKKLSSEREKGTKIFAVTAIVILMLTGGCTGRNIEVKTEEKNSISKSNFAVRGKGKLPEYFKFNSDEFYNNVTIVYSEKDRGTYIAAKEIESDLIKKRKVNPIVKKESDVTIEDLEKSNLILIGNNINNRVVSSLSGMIPGEADGEKIIIKDNEKGNITYKGKNYGVTYYYPNLFNTQKSMVLILGNSESSYKTYDFKKSDILVSMGKSVSPRYYTEKEFITFGNSWKIDRREEYVLDTGENDVLKTGESKRYPFPEWARGKTIYEIFVRSFCDSNGDGIGDINGMVSKLDYLQSIGVDIIWVMPIFQSPSYHGYDTSDYFKINKEYGTNEDFIRAAKEIHKRGMKIILDVPFNQASRLEPHFADAYGNPSSKYDRWFYFYNQKNTVYNNYEFKSDEAGKEITDGSMPAWNTNNPEVVDFHASVAKFWADPDGDGDYSDGADGYRLDYARGPSHEYWKELYSKIKNIRSELLLIGEAWLELDEIARFFDNQFDAAYDFNLQGSLTTGLKKDIDNGLAEEDKKMPENAYFARFLSNHDMDRLPTFKNIDEQKLDAALIYTLKGMPTLYYGDEIGMKGSKDGAGDEGRRRPMEWYKDNKGKGMTTWETPYDKNIDGISVEEEDGKEGSLLEYYKKLSSVRKMVVDIIENSKREDLPVYEIKDGKEISARKVKGYINNDGRKAVLTLLNFGKEGEYIIDFTKGSVIDKEVKDYMGSDVRIKVKKEKINIRLEGNRAYILTE